MQSTSFRLVSAMITLLLLAGLIAAVGLVMRTAPSSPPMRQPPLSAPSDATVQHTIDSTASQATITSTGQALSHSMDHQLAAGGFRFVQPPTYDLDLTTTAATLTNSTGAIFVLRGGTPAQLSSVQATALDLIFDEFVAFYARQDNFQSRNKQPILVRGANGRMVDLVSQTSGDGFSGRIVMVQPALDQLFLLVGISPARHWEQTVHSEFEALLASVSFFPLPTPQATTALLSQQTINTTAPLSSSLPTPTSMILLPTPLPLTPLLTTPSTLSSTLSSTPSALRFATTTQRKAQSGWRVYSNSNVVNALTVLNTTIWAATDGGVGAWNRSNNSFVKYTTLDGLGVNRTTAVVNCPLPGFGLTLGSAQGLQIFDQQRDEWKVLNSANSEMHFDDVSALYCNQEKGFLVVGYAQHGLDIFDGKSESWTAIDQRRGLPQNTVKAVTVVGDRAEIWVSWGAGIAVLTADRVNVYDKSNAPLENHPVKVMVSEPQGTVWLGAGDKVYRIDNEQWTIYSATYVLASAFPTGEITALALVGDGTLWIGSKTGELCLFDPTVVTCQSFFTPEALSSQSGITGLALDALKRVYVATARAGVRVYDGKAWRVYNASEEIILSNHVRTFAQDGDGFLWLATDVGLYQINPANDRIVQLFTSANTPYPVEEIVTLFLAPGGGLWVGGKGVGYFDGAQWITYTTADGLASDQIQAIAGDTQERIWFGTDRGLSIWNGESFFTLTRADRLPSDNILSFLAEEEAMWIGSDAGLLRFAGNQFQIYTTATAALAGNRISVLARVADGALLVGTDKGVSRWLANKMSIIDETRGYAVTAIALAQDDTVWLGTHDQGLLYFDGQSWTAPPHAVNLPAPSIRALAVDLQGSLWLAGAEGGMIRYDP